ncbi:DUF624 domain-containing protein [Nesterenkonia ebinurensis]|uniref:DUF624 domain-containing protein n=1 Tax=Nesterenkonia ebinurensis TaxID=2608252 RepID=UPI00123D70DB|nr:DUF624 domain-containing protein [Nesterenkonia ebinurensis]
MDLDREGPLTRLTNFVYRLIVIEAAFVLVTLPALIGIFFLEQHPSNIPLYAVFTLFFGPAISAGVYAWRADQDVVPWLRYWKGYIESFVQTMVVWIPVVTLCTLVAFNAAYSQVSTVFIIGGFIIAAGAAIYGVALLCIIANFSFRTRDLFAVVMFGTAHAPLSALGIVSHTILAGAIVFFWADWVLVLLASFMLVLLARIVRPMLIQINEGLVKPGHGPLP